MADAPAPADTATTPTPTTPWHQGVEADVLGAWQNKGYDLSDPVKVAIESGKAARELEKMLGGPKDQLVRLPQNANDPAAWRPVWERLGAPKEAKDYGLETLKYSDGDPLEPALADSLRATFHARGIPKDAALDIAKAVMKEAEGEGAARATEMESKRAEQTAALDRLWGARKGENMQTAINGARRSGFTPDQVKAMEAAVGIDVIGEFFRRIGADTNEDRWTDGTRGSGTPATSEAARAQWNDLKGDREFRARMLANPNGPEAKQFKALMEQMTGINEATELANL